MDSNVKMETLTSKVVAISQATQDMINTIHTLCRQVGAQETCPFLEEGRGCDTCPFREKVVVLSDNNE